MAGESLFPTFNETLHPMRVPSDTQAPLASLRSSDARPAAGAQRERAVPGRLLAAIVAGVFFLATLPTLGRLEFFDGVEHINLATVQEMRRNAAVGEPVNWLLPTLEGEARTIKPPLTAWLSAVPVSTETVRKLAAPAAGDRAAAFEQFVRQCRVSAVLGAGLMLLAVYELGRMIGGGGLPEGDRRVGWASVIVCASMLLFLRQGRRATTDIQLALWVSVCNAFLAAAIIENRRWVGFLGAGVALGLSSMSKGPHIALLQTAVPFTLFALWRHRAGLKERVEGTPNDREQGGWLLPLLAGVALALIVGLWWYVYVWATVPAVWSMWLPELTRAQANRVPPSPWYEYLRLGRWLLPWTAWALVGGWAAGGAILRPLSNQAPARPRVGANTDSAPPEPPVLALLLLLPPILVMTCFHERWERYLIPFAGPAAVLAGWAIVRYFDRLRSAAAVPLADRLADAFTWAATAYLAILLPLLGISTKVASYRTWDGRPWFSTREAVTAATLGAFFLAAGFIIWRRGHRTDRRLAGALLGILLACWVGAEMALRGIALSANEGVPQQRLAELIWNKYPEARLYSPKAPTKYGSLSLPSLILSLDADRPIAVRPNPLPTIPGPRPLLLITDVTDDEPPAPPPIPPGWHRETIVPIMKGKRYVQRPRPIKGSEGILRIAEIPSDPFLRAWKRGRGKGVWRCF